MSADFAIIGAGSGGQSLAAFLGLRGFTTILYDIDKEKIEALRAIGKIEVSGVLSGSTNLFRVTTEIRDAISEARVVFVVVHSHLQGEVARAMAPFLGEEHIIVLSPGATGGAFEVRAVLNELGCSGEIVIAETQDLVFTCRSACPGEVSITGIKKDIGIAALPSSKVDMVSRLLNEAFLQLKPVPNVFHTSLANLGPIAHPGPTLLNAARVDAKCDFEFFKEGFTPSVSRLVEKMDAERVAIGKAFGVELCSAGDWLWSTYGVEGKTLCEAYKKVVAYRGLKGPTTMETRYIQEDVPSGLVPLAMLAGIAGIKTPAMRAVIEIANIITGRNFWEEGRTLKKLGLEGKSLEEVKGFAF